MLRKNPNPENPVRLAILQRVCTSYRVALFSRLSNDPGLHTMLFIGDDVPCSKVMNAANLAGVNHRKISTRFIRLGKRVLPWHVGLVGELAKFDPDVILCEGESHFIGYLQAICYKFLYKRRVALMHWCFISLPGWTTVGGDNYRSWIKKILRNFFDAFVVYSSFSKDCLVKLGQGGEKIFIATNVGDIDRFIKLSELTKETRSEARKKLNLPERFTVLYLGALEEVKRPDVMLDMARGCDHERFNFVLLGGGGLLQKLRDRTTREKLGNVFLPGHVTAELPLYYRAADILLIPGRGGIIISEAMAFGLPVIVHEADGTEYDLVQNEVTGLRLDDGSIASFRRAVEFLSRDPNICEKMGRNSEQLIRSRFTTANMAHQIKCAAHFAKDARVNPDEKEKL